MTKKTNMYIFFKGELNKLLNLLSIFFHITIQYPLPLLMANIPRNSIPVDLSLKLRHCLKLPTVKSFIKKVIKHRRNSYKIFVLALTP